MRRSTVVLLVLLALVAGVYWYSQQPNNLVQKAFAGEPTPTTSLVAYANLIGPDQGPIGKFTIESAEGQSVVLDRTSGAWTLLVNGEQVLVDTNTAETASINLQSMNLVAILETPPDPKATGLDNPAYTLSAILVDGSLAAFKIGNPTVTDSGYYVEKPDGSVVIVNKYAIETFVGLLQSPPYLVTPTASPLPATETPTATITPEPSATPVITLTPTAQN